jgi:hypothetical protein
VIFAGLTIFLVALVGNVDQDLKEPVTISMVAVQATNENRPEGEKFFEPGLESIRSSLENLPFDTYRKVKSDQARVSAKDEAQFTINERYTLSVTPLSGDTEGRVRVKVWITEKFEKDGKSITRKALDTTSAIVPGKHLLLGGLPMDGGQLAILLTIEN